MIEVDRETRLVKRLITTLLMEEGALAGLQIDIMMPDSRDGGYSREVFGLRDAGLVVDVGDKREESGTDPLRGFNKIDSYLDHIWDLS